MLASSLLVIAAAAALPAAQEPTGRATVFRVDEIRTLAGETLKNATVVVREGVISAMGEAAVVPDHARVIDLRGQGSVLTPPLVLSNSGFLVGGSRRGLNGRFTAAQSLRLDADWGEELLEEGVLLLGVDPPGTGIPGRTSVLDASAADAAADPLVADLYLKVVMSVGSNKQLLRKALEDADKAIDKEEKAREEWQKARAEWEQKQKEKAEAEKKGDGEKSEGGGKETPPSAAQQGGGRGGRGQQGNGKQEEEKEPPKEFTPPRIDPNLEPVVEWVRKQRPAQVWISSAADWLHWLDVLGERELPYEVVLDPGRSTNLTEVKEALGDTGLRVHLQAVPPDRLFLPYTRIRVNLPAELVEAGVKKLVLLPPGGSLADLREWRTGVAQLVGTGLDRDLALRAMSVEPAASLGQEEKVAALKPGAPASFVVWSGDPLAPTSEALYVVSAGETVYDRARAEEEEER